MAEINKDNPAESNNNENPTESTNIVSSDGSAYIYLDKDKMKAYVEISPPTGEGIPCDLEKAKAALHEAKVVFGIDESQIKKALLEENWGRKVLVAQGVPAIDGKDAILNLKYFASDKKLAPREDDKGNVDYRELGLVHNVKKGEVLAERIPPLPGIKGTNVLGKELMPRNGRDFPLPRGKNTVCNEDNTKLYSVIDGHITMVDRKLQVQPVFELNGDVDYSSGNIDFVGNVIIRGSVMSGFTVKAAGDIEITGFIEGAEVIAEGNIQVKGGIKSSYKGLVKAGQNISARFVENSKLEAGQDILIREAIMQSFVRAGGNVMVSDRKATIVGGVIQASHTVEAKIIGSQLATQTIIEVGVNPYHREEYQKLVKSRNETKKHLDNLSNNLQIYQRGGINPQDMPERKRLTIIAMLDEYKKVRQELGEKEARLKILEEGFQRVSTARVRALEVAYPGVKISIGSSVYAINDTTRFAQFILEDEEVRLTSLT
ncbi:Protein of unknown function DUF342 [Syntrophomonas zehnderi OL-4]|uniref:Flagellar Assembly Protein A N-terminal region domain-containing protein n=1 Tax=Syntrophomonas zehnderi OL-4 TaxID=690567 RepID=A0A0E4C8T3_9FIRM|nr:FapA family protein [Syntrophomonas zehnderi]CFX66537.1 Protein of unknown function DUF342 [Syntrophomonas zehnderi OL-4]